MLQERFKEAQSIPTQALKIQLLGKRSHDEQHNTSLSPLQHPKNTHKKGGKTTILFLVCILVKGSSKKKQVAA